MILDKIINKVKVRIVEQKEQLSLKQLETGISVSRPPFQFKKALEQPGIQIIAEIKRASPSAGIIAENFDPVTIATEYAEADVAAISVLTEEDFFQGSLNILSSVRQQVSLPLLRKDFIIDPYQLYQAKYFGADCVLLIAGILPDKDLNEFIDLANELQINTLVEVHDEKELDRALAADAGIIGINNRDLKTFTIDLNTSFRLKEKIPFDKIAVSESGIKNRDQVSELENAGFDAILIGETFMRSGNKKEMVYKLLKRKD